MNVSVSVCVGVTADLGTDSLGFSVKPAPSTYNKYAWLLSMIENFC